MGLEKPLDDPLCTHYYPCTCPLLPQYAQRRLRYSRSDEDDNAGVAAQMRKKRWLYAMKNMRTFMTHVLFNTPRKPEVPPKTRPFRWLMSSNHVPQEHQGGHPPWRMLVRHFCMDLPMELTWNQDLWCMKSWKRWPVYERTYQRPASPVNAPPEVTCGKRLAFSLVTHRTAEKKLRILFGDWLVVVYIWASDSTWLKKANVSDLVSFSSVIGIRAWEWVDAVDSPKDIPYLFYELERQQDGTLKDTVFGGQAYKEHDTVPIRPGDPVPPRLAGIRRLLNKQGRKMIYADWEELDDLGNLVQ
ncbi:hypothetical protein V8C26DRAFT_422427 [Trichoderma gracile]